MDCSIKNVIYPCKHFLLWFDSDKLQKLEYTLYRASSMSYLLLIRYARNPKVEQQGV
jgi:hypothetical protein